MESAIAKMLTSELLRKIIECAEEIYGWRVKASFIWSKSASVTHGF